MLSTSIQVLIAPIIPARIGDRKLTYYQNMIADNSTNFLIIRTGYEESSGL